MQGYDFHGAGSDNSWEPNRTGHQANLYVDTDDPYSTHFSVDSAVKVYTDAGVSTRKLTIGIPFYGRGWQQVADGGQSGEWQSANGAAPGRLPGGGRHPGYKNIAANVPGCTVHHDEQAVATYCYTGRERPVVDVRRPLVDREEDRLHQEQEPARRDDLDRCPVTPAP